MAELTGGDISPPATLSSLPAPPFPASKSRFIEQSHRSTSSSYSIARSTAAILAVSKRVPSQRKRIWSAFVVQLPVLRKLVSEALGVDAWYASRTSTRHHAARFLGGAREAAFTTKGIDVSTFVVQVKDGTMFLDPITDHASQIAGIMTRPWTPSGPASPTLHRRPSQRPIPDHDTQLRTLRLTLTEPQTRPARRGLPNPT